MRNPSTSRCSTDYEREFFLYKLKKAQREFERCQRKKQEFEEKHVCEASPYIVHDYQPYTPFLGCFKRVCKFCLQESPAQNFQPSVYSFKGRSFAFTKKHKRHPPRRYEC